eukprot:GHVQ01002046.1.p1 GENE.GHVQ01002046.1~~GHVQ01002046.1.p1  ORF type:complete len:674 (+),score=158.95 GHVQ01002046.1:1-2022(+)
MSAATAAATATTATTMSAATAAATATTATTMSAATAAATAAAATSSSSSSSTATASAYATAAAAATGATTTATTPCSSTSSSFTKINKKSLSGQKVDEIGNVVCHREYVLHGDSMDVGIIVSMNNHRTARGGYVTTASSTSSSSASSSTSSSFKSPKDDWLSIFTGLSFSVNHISASSTTGETLTTDTSRAAAASGGSGGDDSGFPINNRVCSAQIVPLSVQYGTLSPCEFVVYILTIPIVLPSTDLVTTRPKCFEIMLVSPPIESSRGMSVHSLRAPTDMPASWWLALQGEQTHRIPSSRTCAIQRQMGAPTTTLSYIPWSSTFTGSILGGYTGPRHNTADNITPTDKRDEQINSSSSPPPSHMDVLKRLAWQAGQVPEDPVGTNIDLLSQAVAFPALQEFCSKSHRGSTVRKWFGRWSIRVSEPLSVTTTYVDQRLLYLLLHNITDTTPLEVEDLHVFESKCILPSGTLPIVLHPGEQFSVLLYPDYYPHHQVTSNEDAGWNIRGDEHIEMVVKWRNLLNSGPSVLTNYHPICTSILSEGDRNPFKIIISHPSSCGVGNIITASISLTNTSNEAIDIAALLPKDLGFHRAGTVQPHLTDPPPLIPLTVRKDIGEVLPGSTTLVGIEYYPTRHGIHTIPPIILLDRKNNRRCLVRGGRISVGDFSSSQHSIY